MRITAHSHNFTRSRRPWELTRIFSFDITDKNHSCFLLQKRHVHTKSTTSDVFKNQGFFVRLAMRQSHINYERIADLRLPFTLARPAEHPVIDPISLFVQRFDLIQNPFLTLHSGYTNYITSVRNAENTPEIAKAGTSSTTSSSSGGGNSNNSSSNGGSNNNNNNTVSNKFTFNKIKFGRYIIKNILGILSLDNHFVYFREIYVNNLPTGKVLAIFLTSTPYYSTSFGVRVYNRKICDQNLLGIKNPSGKFLSQYGTKAFIIDKKKHRFYQDNSFFLSEVDPTCLNQIKTYCFGHLSMIDSALQQNSQSKFSVTFSNSFSNSLTKGYEEIKEIN